VATRKPTKEAHASFYYKEEQKHMNWKLFKAKYCTVDDVKLLPQPLLLAENRTKQTIMT
jgi:hypothetical protein